MDDRAAAEVDEQVLADRLRLDQRAALEVGGAAVQRRARARGVGEAELTAGKRRVDPAGHPVNRVALGHSGPPLPGRDQPPRLA